MGIQRRILKSFILFAGDIAIFYAALFFMVFIRHYELPLEYYFAIHLAPFSIIFGIWILAFYVSGLYELKSVKNTPPFYDRLYKVFLFNAVIAISVFYLIPYFQIAPRANLFIVIIIAFLFVAAWRFAAQSVMSRRGASRILFFGLSREVIELADFLKQNPQLGYLPLVAMTAGVEEAPENPPFKIFSFNHHLHHIIMDERVEIIVASSEIKKSEALVRMLFQAVPLGVPVIDFISFYESVTGKIQVSLVGEVWFLENLVGVKKNYYEFFKRAVDLIIAAALGVTALALFPFIALAVKINSAGPIFYKQRRVGRDGKEFSLVKYRSMITDAEKMDWRKGSPAQVFAHNTGQSPASNSESQSQIQIPKNSTKIWAGDGSDPRHTGVGAILRKSYLDELPQIINVFRGEMSFVGPRPERLEFVRELKKRIPFYEMRLLVKPGITGWAQVNMENDASVEDAMEKIQYDLAYIKNRSVWLDVTIALRTIMIMLSRGGR